MTTSLYILGQPLADPNNDLYRFLVDVQTLTSEYTQEVQGYRDEVVGIRGDVIQLNGTIQDYFQQMHDYVQQSQLHEHNSSVNAAAAQDSADQAAAVVQSVADSESNAEQHALDAQSFMNMAAGHEEETRDLRDEAEGFANTATSNASTASTKANEASGSASDAATSASDASDSALDASNSASAALTAQGMAEDWAESPTAPGDPGTKSAKTWAAESAASAASASASADVAGGWWNALRTEDIVFGQRLTAAYDDRFKRDPIPPGFDPYRGATEYARGQIRRAMLRLLQMTRIAWTPAGPFPMARARLDSEGEPAYYPAGLTRYGVPYASIQQYGDLPGLEVNLRAFRDAARNKHSVLFTQELFHGSIGGRAFYGANCSGFIAYAFQHGYYYSTMRMAAGWDKIGFIRKWDVGEWDADTVAIGDIIVTRPEIETPRHVEIIYDVTPTSVSVFDQGYEGPGISETSRQAFNERMQKRQYILLRYDWHNADRITYTPNPDSPLPGEDLPPAPLNPVVTVDRGDTATYPPEHDASSSVMTVTVPDVTFTIFDPNAETLVVSRDGVVVDTITINGAETIARHYDIAGNYKYHCIMTDSTLSQEGRFAVSRVNVSLDKNTASLGEEVTVTFSVENGTAFLLSTTSQPDQTVPNWRELTPEEVENGSATFTRNVASTPRVYIYAKTPDGGMIFNHPRIDPATRVVFS